MRLLMLSHGYPPTISGVTLVAQKVARAMVARGHHVTMVTASDQGAPYEDEDQGVRLLRVRSAPNPFWSEGRLPLLSYDHLKELVEEIEPDVINTHDGALLSRQLYRLKHEKGIVPEVLTCHFLPDFVTYYVRAGDAVERALESITWDVTIRMVNAFDHVVFPTATQQAIFKEEGLETPSSVISNGLDRKRYHPGQVDLGLEKRYPLPDRPRVLFVSRLALDKKIDVLIQAVAKVERACLLIVGRGDDQPRLEKLVSTLGLDGRVRFLGFVPEEDLPDIYRLSDVFAIASDVEVQSIPTLQAVSSGLPIVAADAGALPELVEPGVNGYLAPPDNPEAFADALRRVLDSPRRAEAFGKASLLIARAHGDEETVAAYEQLFLSISADREDGNSA